jgi:hypothetical protein
MKRLFPPEHETVDKEVRKGSDPQVMATLRNLSISLLRMAGAKNIASATRHLGRRSDKALRLLGLTA